MMDATTKDLVIQYLIDYSRQLERQADDFQAKDHEKSVRLQAKAQQVLASALTVSKWQYFKAIHYEDPAISGLHVLH